MLKSVCVRVLSPFFCYLQSAAYFRPSCNTEKSDVFCALTLVAIIVSFPPQFPTY